MRRLAFLLILVSACPSAAVDVVLPLKPKSVRFAFIGDNGTGEPPQYEMAKEMMKEHGVFPFDFVIMMGDNIYGSQRPADFKRKFEEPYQPLLDAGVNFYASLGNHDDPNQRLYKPFHMDGKRYYDFQQGNAEFFALDSNYMDREQLDWLKKELTASNAAWKICFFHHPLYSHARDHGPDVDLRRLVEPLFEQNGVNVVISGHEHSYERLKPQNGIAYFVLGNSGQLRLHNLRPSADTEKGFDTDRAFGMVEISGDELYFQIVSRTGQTVDSGTLKAGNQKPVVHAP
jgi:3',5'-cyclic AMP phosphodiesterase CpdA